MRVRIALFVLLVLCAGLTAQAAGFAFAVFEGSLPFDPAISVTPTGVKIQFEILCYESTTRQKAVNVISVDIPDGSTPLQTITLETDAIVVACGAQGITVARTRVFVPAFMQGQ